MNAPFWGKVWLSIGAFSLIGLFGSIFLAIGTDGTDGTRWTWQHKLFTAFLCTLISWMVITGAIFLTIAIWFPQG